MRDRYDDITSRGAVVVAVGTGDVRYAKAFVDDERVPFVVLVDDDGAAARAASLRKASAVKLLDPRAAAGSRRAWSAGHRIHKPGARVSQLGATFVVGPGDVVHYEHLDGHTADHAPLDDVLAAVPDRSAYGGGGAHG